MAQDHFTPTEFEPLNVERVSKDAVEYLCFEGGGGKGVIFLGALQELERRRVIRYSGQTMDPRGQIKGLAGSSAGALTAVLLSCGYRANQIESLLFGGYDFNNFFDQPGRPAKVPSPTGASSSDHAPWLTRKLGRVISYPINQAISAGAATGSRTDGAAAKLGSPRILHYLMNLYHHWGIFSGSAAHNLFRHLIGLKVAAISGGQASDHYDLTFRQHKEIFGVELVLTGSNFSTGQTSFFSADTSPDFPVAAAARISMSLPIIYKPMNITARTAHRYSRGASGPRAMSASELTGVWVDGGYMNNLPRTAFAHHTGALAKTLSFSLNDFGARPRMISSFWDFLGAYLGLGLMGTGESQSSRSTGALEDTVPLLVGDRRYQIKTTDFGFTAAQIPHVRRLVTAAQAMTNRYFDNRPL